MPASTSPAKRRKKTPKQTTPHKTKPIDFFFRKQTETQGEAPPSTEDASRTSPSPLANRKVGNLKEQPEGDDAPEHGLTDEEYARKLAADWGVENAQAHVAEDSSASSHGVKRKHDERNSSEPDSTRASSKEPPRTGPPVTNKPAPSKDLPKAKEVSLQADTAARNLVDEIPFDSDPLSFDPGEYCGLAGNWPEGKATYAFLTRAFVLVDGTRSRIKIVDTLVNMIRTLVKLDPESLLPAVSYALGL